MRITSRVVIFSIILLFISATSTTAQTAQQVAKQAFTATVLLVFEDNNGQPFSMGSGFFVQDGVLATNLHVLEGAQSGYAKLVNQKARVNIEGVLAIDPSRDLALLKVSLKGITPLSLVSITTIEVADVIYAVGNPYGLEGTFSQGIISGIRDVGADKLLQITAPISPGSSGGPVLNQQGQVVGVSVATFEEGQNLNFAIPADYLLELLSGNLKLASIGSTGSGARSPSILSGNDNRAQEYVTSTAFAWTDNQYMGLYNFSIRNNLRQAIKNVVCIVIFYAKDGLPIETEFVTLPGPVGAGLAKRSSQLGRTNANEVRNLTTKTEIRILSYELLN